MSIYVIPTVPTFHIGRSLKDAGFQVMYPEPHEKNSSFYFPGGECYCRLPRVRELERQDVKVVHSGYSGSYLVNDGLEHLRQILYILRNPRLGDKGALKPPRTVHLFVLSFPYGKQDNNWEDGENNRAEQLIYEFLQYCNSITVVAPHFITRPWAKELLEQGLVEYLSPYHMLCDAIARDYPNEEFMHVSPGKFARTEFPSIRTHRTEGLNVVIDDEIKQEDYRGKNVVVVDDITYTGKTALQFAIRFRQIGVSKLMLALPHIGTVDALRTIAHDDVYDRIYTTNSCDVFSELDQRNPRLKILDISPLLIDVIRRGY